MGSKNIQYVRRKICASVVVAIAAFQSSYGWAQEESELSRAEQAALEALAAQRADAAQKKIDLCNHVLVYGLQEQKQQLLAELGDMTCEEAVNAQQ